MKLDAKRLRYADYFDWYAGDTDSLFNIGQSLINGLQIVRPQELSTRFNYFGAISRFYADALIGDTPPENAAVAGLIEDAALHWAVTGECCFSASASGLRTIRPDYVFPVFDKYDKDIVVKILFIFPERDAGDTQYTNKVQGARQARVVEYDMLTGVAYESIRKYTGSEIDDGPQGSQVSIGPVVWVDTSDGIYHLIDGLVREITVRLNILQLALNTTALPLLQVDTDSIAGGRFQQSRPSPSALTDASKEGMGLTVAPPFIGEEGARYIERTGQGLSESMDYIRMMLGQLGVLSGVPDYVFGIQMGSPANETERVMAGGTAKINRFRRSLETALKAYGVTVEFGTEPFVTRSNRVENLVAEYTAGISTLNETRAALGKQPLQGASGVSGLIARVLRRGEKDVSP